MSELVLYYWAPCPTCSIVTHYADEHDIALDKRDVEQEQPYQELLALGGDADLIPYLHVDDQLIQGTEAILEYFKNELAS